MAAYDPTGLPDMSEDVPPANANGENSYAQQPADDSADDSDYDPSFGFDTAVAEPAKPQEAAPPPPPDSRPKTVGGFIVEESDEEDEQQQLDTHMSEAAAPLSPQPDGKAETSSGVGGDVPVASDEEPTQEASAAASAPPPADTSLTGSAAESAIALLPTVDASASSSLPDASQQQQSSLTSQQQQQQGSSNARVLLAPMPPPAAEQYPPVSLTATPRPPTANGVASTPVNGNAAPTTATNQRLPHDIVGRLEDRIKDDPKADIEAWWELIQHYRNKNQIDNCRRVFDRMLEVWPTNVRPSVSPTILHLPATLADVLLTASSPPSTSPTSPS